MNNVIVKNEVVIEDLTFNNILPNWSSKIILYFNESKANWKYRQNFENNV